MKNLDFILNTSDVPRRTANIISTGEPLGMVADLAELAGLRHLRIQHEILLPGRRSSSPHAHTMREEFLYILQGAPDPHGVNEDSPGLVRLSGKKQANQRLAA